MNKIIVAVAAGLTVSACGGSGTNPFTANATSSATTTGTTNTSTGVTGSTTTPPGTTSPSPAVGIFRSEPTSTEIATGGNGYVTDVSYDSTTDTFSVDNLGFDGGNVYPRGTTVSSFGPYAVYEATSQFPDTVSGTPINQFTHRAIYGVSTSQNTKFAIVRTGSYIPYGFGGFIYQRDNAVALPTTGQALYNGVMAGLRDFNGSANLQYTTADISISIDFDDFNDTTSTRGDAVRGTISNRVIYDINGNDITSTVVAGFEAENNITLGTIPVATFTVGPGVMDDNGEILGSVQSYYTDSSGQTQVFEQGNYYAVVAGTNAEEIVGVVVLESTLAPNTSSVRDTSGFIVYR
jgi:hypothetical protein